MSANLITGNLFSPITAAEDSDFQAGICGNVTKIMPVGNQMALAIEDANTISVADGVIITKEGRRIQIDTGDIDEFTIPTGTQGTTAYYIIGFHLYTDSDTAAELCETFVEAVESASSTITENTFKDGYTEVYVSLGMVVQDGVNLDSVTALLDVADTIESIAESIGSTDISSIGDGTVTGAISKLNSNLNKITSVVQYTTNATDTYASAFTALFNLIDTNLITAKSVLQHNANVAQISDISNLIFNNVQTSGSNYAIVQYSLKAATARIWTTDTSGTTISNVSNELIGADRLLRIRY